MNIACTECVFIIGAFESMEECKYENIFKVKKRILA